MIVPGRFFLSRIITLSCTVGRLHHRIYINTQVREDLCIWYKFLSDWNWRELFLSDHVEFLSDLEFYTDPLAKIGFGGFFQGSWFHDRWTEGEINLCMIFKELFPIVIASSLWRHLWKGKRLLVHCDNEGAIKALNKGYTP